MDRRIVAPTLPTHGYSTVYFYPTISPHIVVIPILSCIIGFPIFTLLVICGLRKRARKARLKEKRRRPVIEHTITELVPHTVFNQSRYLNQRVVRMKDGRRKTIVRFKPMPEIDLDTVIEEKTEYDDDVNASELLKTVAEEKPILLENIRASFRSFRFGYGASGQKLSTSADDSFNCNLGTSDTKSNLSDQVADKSQTLDNQVTITIEANPTLITPNVCTYITSSQNIESDIPLAASNETLSFRDSNFKCRDSVPSSLSVLKSPVKCHIREIGASKSIACYINVKEEMMQKQKFCFKTLSKSCEEIEFQPELRSTHRPSLNQESPKECTILRKLAQDYFSSSYAEKDNVIEKFEIKSDGNLVSSIIRKYESLASREIHNSSNYYPNT